jgi:hypothetical protein
LTPQNPPYYAYARREKGPKVRVWAMQRSVAPTAARPCGGEQAR